MLTAHSGWDERRSTQGIDAAQAVVAAVYVVPTAGKIGN